MTNDIGSSSHPAPPNPHVPGDTPLHLAVRYGRTDILKKIIENKRNAPQPTSSTSSGINALLNVQNTAGDTPLHLAVRYRRNDMITALLLSGADPNIPNLTGESAGVSALSAPHLDDVINSFAQWNKQTKGRLILDTVQGNKKIYRTNIRKIQKNLSSSTYNFHKLLKSTLWMKDKNALISDNILAFSLHTFEDPKNLASFVDIKLDLPHDFKKEIESLSTTREIRNPKYHELINKYAKKAVEDFDTSTSKKADILSSAIRTPATETYLDNIKKRYNSAEAAKFSLIYSITPTDQDILDSRTHIIADRVKTFSQRNRAGFLTLFSNLLKHESSLIRHIKEKYSPEVAARYALTHGVEHNDGDVKSLSHRLLAEHVESEYKLNPKRFLDRLNGGGDEARPAKRSALPPCNHTARSL